MHDLDTIIKRNEEAAKSELSRLFTDERDYDYLYTARYWYYIKADFSVSVAARLANADVTEARQEYVASLPDIAGHLKRDPMVVDNELTGEQDISWKRN